MRAIIRSLIVWLVLLAVPFQGYAAAAALPCAPARAAPAVTHQVAHDHHAMLMAAAGSHHDATAHHAAGHDGNAHHAGAKCGSCAACWVGPALASAGIGAAGPQLPQSVSIPFAGGHLPSVHPSLPERPPRSILA